MFAVLNVLYFNPLDNSLATALPVINSWMIDVVRVSLLSALLFVMAWFGLLQYRVRTQHNRTQLINSWFIAKISAYICDGS